MNKLCKGNQNKMNVYVGVKIEIFRHVIVRMVIVILLYHLRKIVFNVIPPVKLAKLQLIIVYLAIPTSLESMILIPVYV